MEASVHRRRAIEPKDPKLPALRRELILPAETTDLYEQYKTLRQNHGQLIRWKRLPGRGWICGVCAGLAYRFGFKPWQVRLTFVLGTLFFAGLPAVFYFLAATFVSARKRFPKDYDRRIKSLPPHDDSA